LNNLRRRPNLQTLEARQEHFKLAFIKYSFFTFFSIPPSFKIAFHALCLNTKEQSIEIMAMKIDATNVRKVPVLATSDVENAKKRLFVIE
jgi:hypothetical protein